MWLDPTNKNRFYVGQDGGASLTYDHGKTWVFFDNLCLSQFYAVSADMRDPYYVYGGLQDNGTWGGPSMSREGMILTDFWFNFNGGDGFHTQNDPTDWRIVYSESQGGSAQRTNVETRESRSIQPRPNNVINYKDFYPDTPAPAGQARRTRRWAARADNRRLKASAAASKSRPGSAAAPRSPRRPNRASPRGSRRSTLAVPFQLEHAHLSCLRTTPASSIWAGSTSSGPRTAATTG